MGRGAAWRPGTRGALAIRIRCADALEAGPKGEAACCGYRCGWRRSSARPDRGAATAGDWMAAGTAASS